MVCGSADIAVATGEKIKKYDAVVWSHHGIFCCGPDFDTAFGLMDTIEKAAEILIKVMSCGGKRQSITKEQILALSAWLMFNSLPVCDSAYYFLC